MMNGSSKTKVLYKPTLTSSSTATPNFPYTPQTTSVLLGSSYRSSKLAALEESLAKLTATGTVPTSASNLGGTSIFSRKQQQKK
jgi:hypothetical protein